MQSQLFCKRKHKETWPERKRQSEDEEERFEDAVKWKQSFANSKILPFGILILNWLLKKK